MHAWEAIQSAVDHIEERLASKIDIEELAQSVALSSFYFQRLFTRLVGRPVNEYTKMRRLAKSCDLLRDKNNRILDVALDCGFGSHESFTKSFKSAYGITPQAYRKNPVHLNNVIKPDLLLNYTMIDEDVPLIVDSIVIEVTRKKLVVPELYLGFSGQVPVDSQIPVGEATGVDVPGQLWESFHKAKERIAGLAKNGVELGASMAGEQDKDSFTYFVGALAEADKHETDEFVTWELPAAEYLVCRVEAENFTELTTSALYKAIKYIYETWLPSHKMITLPFSAEKYYKSKPSYSYMEIWVVPVSADNEAK